MDLPLFLLASPLPHRGSPPSPEPSVRPPRSSYPTPILPQLGIFAFSVPHTWKKALRAPGCQNLSSPAPHFSFSSNKRTLSPLVFAGPCNASANILQPCSHPRHRVLSPALTLPHSCFWSSNPLLNRVPIGSQF